MSIVDRVTTLRLPEHPNLCYVLLRTSDGLTGLGETFYGARAVDAYIHESVASHLLGEDPTRIDRHEVALVPPVGYTGAGVETRGNSAVNIALYDLAGKAFAVPVYQLLGGLTRDSIRVYNTCAGYSYVRGTGGQRIDNWGLSGVEAPGPYEDLDAFLHRADELALSLRSEGITGMKIWPFDSYAGAGDGGYISPSDLDRALEPFRKIRAAVGDDMDVMVELHGLWNLPTAQRIARAVEEFDPYWFEDPMRAYDVGALADFARSTRVPLTLSETIAGRAAFSELLRRRAVDIVMLDVSWVGGLGEARRIAAMAESAGLPVTAHDCTGPVVLAASTHLSCAVPNALTQETVRASYTSWYRDLVTTLPPLADGRITPPAGPGLGVELRPELFNRPDVDIHVSELGDT